MLTQNWPAGLRETIHRTSRVAASVFSAFLAVSPVLAAAGQQKQDAPPVQITPVQAPVILEVVDINEAVTPKAQVTLTNESTGAVTTAPDRLRWPASRLRPYSRQIQNLDHLSRLPSLSNEAHLSSVQDAASIRSGQSQPVPQILLSPAPPFVAQRESSPVANGFSWDLRSFS